MAQFPSTSSASGIWSLTDVRNSLMGSNWPVMPSPGNTAAWFAGGNPAPFSTVDRITFATDTATATTRGPLSSGRTYFAAAGNTTNGWFGGGTGAFSTVERITYASDTAATSTRGPLSLARYTSAAAAGVQ